MASLIADVINYIYDDEKTDPRTKNFFLASSPTAIIVILISYLFFCLRCGPKFMENRKPYDLKNVMLVYNALQVLLSLFIVVVGVPLLITTNFNFACQPIIYEDNPSIRTIHLLAWTYYFGKITELLDTVFFVLRKKYNQVTFLHVYHHASMPAFSYFGFRYYPNGHGIIFGLLNTTVHIIMYTYYLISGLGPQYQKYLWWKKHVTTIQLVQFFLIFAHNFIPLFTSCTYPKMLHVILCVDSALFFYLFGKFYIKNYYKEETKSNGTTNGSANGKEKLRAE